MIVKWITTDKWTYLSKLLEVVGGKACSGWIRAEYGDDDNDVIYELYFGMYPKMLKDLSRM